MLKPSEHMLLRAVCEGTLRRRRTAPPLESVPSIMALVERDLLRIRDGKLFITEDGLGALEAADYDLRKSK